MRKVGKYDDDWNLIEVFENTAELRKAGYRNAYAVLKGVREHCNGYRFKYIEYKRVLKEYKPIGPTSLVEWKDE